MVDQLVAVLKGFDTAVLEQIIAVPKISWPSRPLRAATAAAQMAEQLVEVPQDVVAVLLRQPVEQTVDIPAPGACGFAGYGSLQGFLQEQRFASPSLSVEQNVDIPVPGRGSSGYGSLQGFLQEQRFASPSLSVEQNVDIPVPGRGSSGMEVFEVSPQDRVQQPSSSVQADEPFQGFFFFFRTLGQ